MIRAAILALFIATPAIAEDPACGGFADLSAQLSQRYGEAQVFMGVGSNGLLSVLFINPETRSWTALMVGGDGKACMVAEGGNAEFTYPEPEGVDG